MDALGRNTTTPRDHVQRNTLSEEDVSRFAPDGGDVFDRLERLALLYVPFYPARENTQSAPSQTVQSTTLLLTHIRAV